MSTHTIALMEAPTITRLPPLIRQHLSPPQGEAPALRRQRLLSLLDGGAEHYPVTLLVAPAGAGKTALLRSWVEARPAGEAATAWLSLCPLADAPLPFAALLLASLMQAGALPEDPPDWVRRGVAPAPYTKLLPDGDPSLLPPLAWALNIVAEGDARLILILDGYDAIADPAAHQVVDLLIAHAPPQLRLVIAGRGEPPLPVARLRASGRLAELPADALRWDVDEAEELLAGAGLGRPELARLVEYTEGWSAGLYLAGRALARGPSREAALAEFFAGHPFVLDYLRDEALGRETAALQTFLLKSALLPELSAARCEGLLADGEPGHPSAAPTYGGYPSAQAALDAVVRRGLFLAPVAGRPGRYRYHPLFAHLLNVELRQRHPHWVEPLLRGAGAASALLAPPADLALVTGLAEPLSDREGEILFLIALGCSNREIADRLSIVEGTVKTHVRHIFGKLGASNRTEAVAIARSMQLIA